MSFSLLNLGGKLLQGRIAEKNLDPSTGRLAGGELQGRALSSQQVNWAKNSDGNWS